MKHSDASLAQIAAANPETSTWLSANAGSGKTRVLTDRVARLLLRDVPPQRILCLTYTRAAATEMQNRLFGSLGAWAMADDATLTASLNTLGLERHENTPALRQRARTLFARAIETPGGLKLQTIHSFCASLLRRFPLEAQVAPGFAEMDDRAAQLLLETLLDSMAGGPDQALFDAMARVAGGQGLVKLSATLLKQRADFQPKSRADLAKALGCPEDLTLATLADQTFAPGDTALLGRLVPVLRAGSSTDQKTGDAIAPLLAGDLGPTAMLALEGKLLFGAGAKDPFGPKIDSFPTKATRAALGEDLPALNALMQRLADARPLRLALEALDQAESLNAFAARLLPAYAAAKQARGWLDFDDLILKARDLLARPDVAQWVLFRLDGGIDHILVDEAQDTSPLQWQIIRDLSREFAAGKGARSDIQRTIFVVGDPKQSIYSFQGADPVGFGKMQDYFDTALRNAAEPFQSVQLRHSFRSSSAVLKAVDACFAAMGPLDAGVESAHLAFHQAMPGRVDLWPIQPKTDTAEKLPFDSPIDALAAEHHQLVLARRVVDEIKQLIDARTPIEEKGKVRAVRPGDFLILVQRRSDIFHELIRACKERGVPVAGADRLRIGGEIAVRDLLALLNFAATPEDDLSLATVLRSPLCNWTEAQLYDLAHARGENQFLWSALRDRADVPDATKTLLTDILDQADFLRPFDLIDRVLTRHDGRRALLARLGPEAEDGIDALLGKALGYERLEIPSLTGFLGWMAEDISDMKRPQESQGNAVRVMTVHGAKGLEAPIVILPDCAKRRAPNLNPVLRLADDTLVWRGSKDSFPPAVADAVALETERHEKERLRLLYVAMTRAKSWLIVAAAGDADSDCWYAHVRDGLVHLGADSLPRPDQPGLRWETGDWPTVLPEPEAPARPDASPAIPPWLDTHPDAAAEDQAPLSPSDLGGAKVLPGEDGQDLAVAMAEGTALHWLLEHLPRQDQARWPQIAAAGPPEAAALLPQAQRVLTDPALAWVFGPDSRAEVAIRARLPGLGNREISGKLDRLIIAPDRVVAIDYKSNRVVPASPAEVPEGLVRQMAAYAEALAQIFPDRPVHCGLLWTASAQVMLLDGAQMRDSLARAAVS